MTLLEIAVCIASFSVGAATTTKLINTCVKYKARKQRKLIKDELRQNKTIEKEIKDTERRNAELAAGEYANNKHLYESHFDKLYAPEPGVCVVNDNIDLETINEYICLALRQNYKKINSWHIAEIPTVALVDKKTGEIKLYSSKVIEDIAKND